MGCPQLAAAGNCAQLTKQAYTLPAAWMTGWHGQDWLACCNSCRDGPSFAHGRTAYMTLPFAVRRRDGGPAICVLQIPVTPSAHHGRAGQCKCTGRRSAPPARARAAGGSGRREGRGRRRAAGALAGDRRRFPDCHRAAPALRKAQGSSPAALAPHMGASAGRVPRLMQAPADFPRPHRAIRSAAGG